MTNMPDFEQISKMMEMFTALQKISEAAKGPNKTTADNKNGEVPIDADKLEQFVNTTELLTIKAAIPFFEERHQKNLGILVKFIELQRIMEFYRDAAGCREGWREEMLSSILPYLDESKQLQAELVIKLLELDSIISKIKKRR